MMCSHRGVSPISRFAANRDPDSRFPAKSGNGGFPDSRFRPNRELESGIPSPIPGQIGNGGNGNWGFPGLVPMAPSYIGGREKTPQRPGPTRNSIPLLAPKILDFRTVTSINVLFTQGFEQYAGFRPISQ